MGQFKLMLLVAFRNLFTSWINLIIGGIIFFGTLLVVVGGALLDSMDEAMSRSIIGSLAGHLQIYSELSKDELALFGRVGSEPSLEALDDFSRIKEVVRRHPNVKAVVPMGVTAGLISPGNTVDLILARLRDLYRRAAEGESPELREQIDSTKAHVRQVVALIEEDLERRKEVVDDRSIDTRDVEALARARSETFWADFDKDPFSALEFLENRIAPQALEGDMLSMRYVGTDLVNFQRTFDRMRIADGTAVPAGHRGLLLSKFYYEAIFKLKSARRLDVIKDARDINHRTIALDPTLQRQVKENQTQTRELLFQLDPIRARQATERLQRILATQESNLKKLLELFFAMDDTNFDTRYQQFYAELAPLLDLYRVRIGDDLVITSFARSGYVQSVRVKLYGTYYFDGLEKSGVAGALNLMDLMSFRELYGHLTEEQRAELRRLQESSGVKHVSRTDAEESFFAAGSDATLVAEGTPGLIDEDAQLDGHTQRLRREELARRAYSQEDLERGMVLSAAVLLKEPEELAKTLSELSAAAEQEKLPLKIVSWQQASGLIGQFVLVAKLVLYAAVFIIFVVALVIINNAMVMATLRRVREVGTMRAIGAQRTFVLGLILLETAVLSMLFGTLGAAAGGGLMRLLGQSGIPAGNEALYFFFSGPRLFPTLFTSNLVVAFVIVLAVAVLSAFYPALLAARVSPLQAMQSDE